MLAFVKILPLFLFIAQLNAQGKGQYYLQKFLSALWAKEVSQKWHIIFAVFDCKFFIILQGNGISKRTWATAHPIQCYNWFTTYLPVANEHTQCQDQHHCPCATQGRVHTTRYVPSIHTYYQGRLIKSQETAGTRPSLPNKQCLNDMFKASFMSS